MQEWPADKVERWPVDRLIPYARNARTHSDAQVAQIAGSIREWGWTVPVLVDESGMLIAGHGRVLAARKLGLTEMPVMVARGWSEAQKRAYVIADNKLALNAGWDVELLRVELTDLKAMGADLGLVGFDDDELAELFADRSVGLTDPDDVPEPLPEPVSSLGRRVAARPASAGLRRQHRSRHGGARAQRHHADADGHRPALWRRLRSRVAAPSRRQ